MTWRATELAGKRLPKRGGYEAHHFPLIVEAMQASRASPRPASLMSGRTMSSETPQLGAIDDWRIARMLRGMSFVQALLTGRQRAELFFHSQVPFAGFR